MRAGRVWEQLCVRPDDELLQLLAYASRALSKAGKNYSVSEQGILAVVWAVEKFDAYVGAPKPFRVITDHNALCGLFKMKNPAGRLARWVLRLRPYKMDLVIGVVS